MLRIKEILSERNIKQKDFALELGITPVGLNKIINGNPTLNTLMKIASTLNIDIKDLFESKYDKNKKVIYIKEENEFKPIGRIKIDGIKDN